MSECPACGRTEYTSSFWGKARYEGFEYQYLRCRNCGSTFIDPMPDDELLDRLYSPEYLRANCSEELEGGNRTAELAVEVKLVVALLAGRKAEGSLLDVGCGGGSFLLTARASGLSCEGLERTAETAEMVSATIRLPVHDGPLNGLSKKYDVIHFADILEHYPRPLEMLIQAKGRLAPRGVVLARGPLEAQPHLFLWLLFLYKTVGSWLGHSSIPIRPPLHVIQFTLEGWHSLLERAQFDFADERVYESIGPASEHFDPSFKYFAKRLSLILTNSTIGRRLKLGSRVISVAVQRA